jgi:hypothetical protein
VTAGLAAWLGASLEWLLPLLAGVAAVATAWLTGKRSGRQAEQQRHLEGRVEAARERSDVDRSVARVDDPADELQRDWRRGM